MLRIFLIRHGETEFNRLNIIQGGGVDAPLNETGLSQAQKFYQKYKNVPFEAVYCSTLQRTYQTVKPFEWLYPIYQDPSINELSWGFIEGKAFEGEVIKQYHHINQQWEQDNLDAKIPNGNSINEVWERLQHFLNQLKQKHHTNVLVCTHGRIMKILLPKLLGYPFRYQNLFTHSNTALTILHFIDNEHFIIEKFKDTSHLQE